MNSKDSSILNVLKYVKQVIRMNNYQYKIMKHLQRQTVKLPIVSPIVTYSDIVQ